MSDKLMRKRRVGLALFAGGIALTLACHLAGSWELWRCRGGWGSLRSDELGYDIAVYDARPTKPAMGQVVICGGFAASAQVYFPLALSLLRSGYAVRLVAHSGSPNSKVAMSYDSHGVESTEATRDFMARRPDLPLFLIGHSEGTRYALHTAREIPSVDGVVVISTLSGAVDPERPANVLILVAEDDFDNVKRQTHVLLMSGTKPARPEFDRLYGDMREGTARKARVVAGTNHLKIFLNEEAQRETLDWLNQISHNPDTRLLLSSALKFPALAICALLGAAVSVVGLGVLFPQAGAKARTEGIPAWALLVVTAAGWALAALFANSVAFAQEIPLLIYGRVLVFFMIAAVPLALLAGFTPKSGAGMPRGPWKARVLLVGLTATMLLFDRWLVGVMPMGRRLFWFGLAALISGGYFACDEFLRRGVQRATDWQTGFALGLAGGFIAALSVAGAAFFVGSPVGQFLIGGAVTLFVLMVGCELPATYLFATTGDWLLSWWVRVSVFNGFLAGLVPLVTETEFRHMIP